MTLLKFESQVSQYRNRIFGLAYHLLSNREEAEDVTQEVFMRFWTHRAELDPERVFGWLLRVTRNASLDAIRRRKTYQRSVTSNDDIVDQAPGSSPDPHSDAESAEFNRMLQAALATLDEPYRSLLVLREIQDLPYQEIAEALTLPLTSVKVYLHRARKKLRNQLSQMMPRETV